MQHEEAAAAAAVESAASDGVTIMDDPQGGAAGRDELIHDLADAIAGDATLLLKDWKQLVLVSQIEDGAPDLTGFCYTGDGRAILVTPSDFAIFDVIEALRDAMARADADGDTTGSVEEDTKGDAKGEPKGPWRAALFRLDRETGQLTAEFEYDRPERWLVTPANVKERAREFAPAG
jgi:hypothetical protein